MPTPVNMQGFFLLFTSFPFTLQIEGNWGRSRRCAVLIFRIAYFQAPLIAAPAVFRVLPGHL